MSARELGVLPILLTSLLWLVSCGKDPGVGARISGEGALNSAAATPTQSVSETEQIAAYGRQYFPDSFSGISLSKESDAILVYRTSGAKLDNAVKLQFPQAHLRFLDALRTERELKDLAERVLRDTEYWQSEGVRVQGVGPDFVNGVVTVITPDNSVAAEKMRVYYDGLVTATGGDLVYPTMVVPTRVSPNR